MDGTFDGFGSIGGILGIDATPTVRAAKFEDAAAVVNLHHTVGFRGEPRDSWPWLWTNNPEWIKRVPSPSNGWVLEAEGEIVGYIGNIPLLCRYGEKTLVAAATSGFAVAPAYRGFGLLLAAAFYKQNDVDIAFHTSSTEASARVYQRFKAVPLPQQDYGKILFWVIRPQPFMSAVLRRVGLNSKLAWFASNLAAGLLRADIAVRGRKPRRRTSDLQSPVDIRLIDSSEIGPEFDDLWDRKISEETRLLAYRTSEVLRWHFARQRAKVACCYRGAELIGYAVVARDDTQSLGLVRSRIVDMFVEKDDPQVVDRLLEAAYRYAASDGSHVLEVIGFPQSIRKVFLKSRPFSRNTPNLPYFFRARDSEIQAELQHSDAWYACPFDGDASL